jgi:HD-like signal output (HDOD) protein
VPETIVEERGAALRTLLQKRLESEQLKLPVMPDVAIRVKRAAEDPASTAGTLSRIIETDPALAARLIRMTNSALYAGLSEIRDLDHAVGRLGTAMVVAVVLGAAGREMFHSDDPMLRGLLDGAWKRSLHAAAVSRTLASHVEEAPEEAFLAGLLHAVGEPILIDLVESLCRAGQMERPAAAELQAAIRALAPVAGSRLLAEWGIPEFIVASVAWQDDPPRSPDRWRPSVYMVALAAAIGAAVVEGRASESDEAERLAELFSGAPFPVDRDAIHRLIAVAIGDGREIGHIL